MSDVLKSKLEVIVYAGLFKVKYGKENLLEICDEVVKEIIDMLNEIKEI